MIERAFTQHARTAPDGMGEHRRARPRSAARSAARRSARRPPSSARRAPRRDASRPSRSRRARARATARRPASARRCCPTRFNERDRVRAERRVDRRARVRSSAACRRSTVRTPSADELAGERGKIFRRPALGAADTPRPAPARPAASVAVPPGGGERARAGRAHLRRASRSAAAPGRWRIQARAPDRW